MKINIAAEAKDSAANWDISLHNKMITRLALSFEVAEPDVD